MKKISFFALLLTVFISCKNKKSDNKTTVTGSDTIISSVNTGVTDTASANNQQTGIEPVQPKQQITLSGTDAEQITQVFTAYEEFMKANRFDEMLDVFYPEIFKRIPKASMLAEIKKGVSTNEYEVKFQKLESKLASEIIPSGNNKYAAVEGKVYAQYVIKAGKEAYKEKCDVFKKSFAGTSTCDDATNTISVALPGVYMMIFDGNYNRWYLLGNYTEKEVQQFIPAEVQKKLNAQLNK